MMIPVNRDNLRDALIAVAVGCALTTLEVALMALLGTVLFQHYSMLDWHWWALMASYLAIVTVSVFAWRYGLQVTLPSIASDLRKACLFISEAVDD
jgi:hypothetical protein